MLLESLKGLGQTLVDVVRTRLESLSLDVREARLRLVSILMLWAFTFLFLALGIVLGAVWLVFACREADRLMVLAVLAVTHLGLGLALLALLFHRLKHWPALFEGTIAELKQDHAALGGGRQDG